MPALTQDELICHDLQQQLKCNFKAIRSQYSFYVCCILSCLKERKIAVKDLCCFLKTTHAFDSEDNDSILLSRRKEKLESAEDINDIVDFIVGEIASFLDYSIFQDIVNNFNLDQGQERLKYPTYLKAYAEKHKLSELLKVIPNLQKKGSEEEELVFKFDIKLSACKLSNMLEFRSSIASILGCHFSTLRILSIDKGCVMVTFAVPEFVAKSVFAEDGKLTPKQVEDFCDLHIVWVKCGEKKISISDDVTLLRNSEKENTQEVINNYYCMILAT